MTESELYALTRMAYHEAGHAVVLWVHGRIPKSLSCNEAGGVVNHGKIIFDITPEMLTAADWQKIRTRALVLLAGEAAERFYKHQINDTDDGYADTAEFDRKDFETLREQVGDHVDAPFVLAWDAMEAEVDALIEEHWDQVNDVAQALIGCSTLTSEKFLAIVAPGG